MVKAKWESPRAAAVVGLGQMGRALARRAVAAGLEVVGVDPDADARAAASDLETVRDLREVDAMDAVLICVPGPDETVATVSSVIDRPQVPRFVVNLSTVGPAVAAALCSRVRADAPMTAYVEAPVSGGVLRTAQGESALLFAAEPAECVAAIEPLLARMVASVIRFPSIRDASLAKLVNNLAVLGTALATLEALEWGVGAGLDPDLLFDALAAGTADSYALRSTLRRPLRGGDLVRGFATRLALKDVRLALDEATARGVPLPFATEVESQLAEGCEQGVGNLAFPAIAVMRPDAVFGRLSSPELSEVPHGRVVAR